MKKSLLLLLIIFSVSLNSFAMCTFNVQAYHYQQGAWVLLPAQTYPNYTYLLDAGDSLKFVCSVGPFCSFDMINWAKNGVEVTDVYTTTVNTYIFRNDGVYFFYGSYTDVGAQDIQFTLTIIMPSITGIAAQNNSENIQVAPNPFKNKCEISLNVSESAAIKYTITDMLGNRLKNVDLNKQVGDIKISEDFSKMPSGIYFLDLKINNKRTVHKLVHQL